MKKKKVILRIILAICLLAVIAFAVMLVRELYIDWQSRSFYEKLSNDANTQSREPQLDPGTENIQQPLQPEDTESSWRPYVDFSALNSKYPGIVAWMKLEGTLLDYPVMQYKDNDYFLTRLPDGTNHRSGSIFLDHRNSSDFSDKSILIYGHETKEQDMFGALKNYRNPEFYEANPIIHLYTPKQDYLIVLFAGHLADPERDHPPLHFEDDEEFLSYIDHLKSISVFKSDVEVSADDRIVSLCTCAYDFSNARLVIVGILVEMN